MRSEEIIPCHVKPALQGEQPTTGWFIGFIRGEDGSVAAVVRMAGDPLLHSVNVNRVVIIEPAATSA